MKKILYFNISIFILVAFFYTNIAIGAPINNAALRPAMSCNKALADKSADAASSSLIVIQKQPIIDIIDKKLLEGLNLNEPKTIIIYGGLGSLTRRYLKDGFKEVKSLFRNVRFIVADVKDPEEMVLDTRINKKVPQKELIKKQMKEIGLPWYDEQDYIKVDLDNNVEFENHMNAVNGNGILTINEKRIKIDGVITAVPTYLHLRIAQEWAKKGVLVWVEKPLSMISELENVHTLVKTYPRQMYCVDYFMDSDAIAWLMAHREVLDSIGKIQSLLGRCVENWRLRNEERGWLLESSKSGGGLAIDSAVHPLAMIAMVLSKLGLGLNLNDANIDDVVLGRYVDPDTRIEADGADENLETAFWMKGHVGDIELMVDSGKGLETVYEGIKIIGEHGAIEVFVGTEEYDPYVKVTLDETLEGGPSTTIYRFEYGQLGYGRTFLDYLLAMYGCTKSSGASFTERFNATMGSEAIVGKAYAFHSAREKKIISHVLGQKLSEAANVDLQVAPEMPKTKERTYAVGPLQETVEARTQL